MEPVLSLLLVFLGSAFSAISIVGWIWAVIDVIRKGDGILYRIVWIAFLVVFPLTWILYYLIEK